MAASTGTTPEAGVRKARGFPLTRARQRHKTRLVKLEKTNEPVAVPPSELFELVEYDSPLGKLPAYLSRPPEGGGKHPAIIWLVGGFDNSIGDIAWAELPEGDDQSASIFWRSGVVTLYPSLRGGNQNPGYIENFLGEVDDVVAVAEFLQTVDYVDPQRIYLGGHSTGGTLALLVAASTDLFRAVFAFGPASDACNYGQDRLTFDTSDPFECRLRSPVHWLDEMRSPTFVYEGTENTSPSLELLRAANKNPLVFINAVEGYDHFSVLFPVSREVAERIRQADDGLPPKAQPR